MDPLQRRLLHLLQSYEIAPRYVIAFSGGCDSTVLLHAISKIIEQLPGRLLAVHINHGLQPQADAWQQYCAQAAAALKIDYCSLSLKLEQQAGNLEARAREARYAALHSMLQSGDVLLTAHHEDDQAETLLLNLLRGSGVEGLSAMQQFSDFGQFHLLRPLLGITLEEINNYAARHDLDWIEDPSNQQSHFDRNFLRNEVVPLLLQRWPAAKNTIARSAHNCQDASQLVHQQAIQDLQNCRTTSPHMLDIEKLQEKSVVQQKYLLRAWFQSLSLALPDHDKLEYIITTFIQCRADARPLLQWSNVKLRRYDGNLYVSVEKSLEPPEQPVVFSRQDIQSGRKLLPGIAGELRFSTVSQDIHDTEKLQVRFREGAESCVLTGRQGHRKLKKLFQQWRVPPWMRQHVPLIYWSDELIAIADFAECGDVKQRPIQHIQWRPVPSYEWRSRVHNHGG
ncbi:MAG: tRNA lysidine(34) synthetase TilS [Chromatiales bacterium]|jgi:tRNA(Ile)-lysidine synthase